MTVYDGALLGVVAGAVLTLGVLGLNRSFFRSAAFLDAADLLERGAARWALLGGNFAPHLLREYANALRQWSEYPEGGRENMPDVRVGPRNAPVAKLQPRP